MDPITVELTNQVLQGISEAPAAAKPQAQPFEVEQSGFAKILDQQMGGQVGGQESPNQALLKMMDSLMGEQGQPMNAIAANDIQVDVTRVGEVQPMDGNPKDYLGNLFTEVNNSQINMDRLIEQLNSGKTFTNQELLRVQVFAQQHTLTYEMMSKVGEMGNQAIQKTFTMQV